MKFLIITHVPHILDKERYLAYGPYVSEMNIWLKYVDNVTVIAPLTKAKISAIDSAYIHKNITFSSIPSVNLLTITSIIIALIRVPLIAFKLFNAMRKADHIHLRCPGNIGLLGCIVQLLFPFKTKTAKYAGNWDSKSRQPLSYRLQKWILSNTFLTRNMKVLVYGEWEGQTKNIKPFFTATYAEKDKTEIKSRTFSETIRFLFVGTLVKGKRPLYAIQIIERLYQLGYNVQLDVYGEGIERVLLENYIKNNNLKSVVCLYGNQEKLLVQNAYKNSHFLILPSESEGWPKVVAEAMFWGCLPLSTKVSCVENMLDFGKRGVLLSEKIDEDVLQIIQLIQNEPVYFEKIKEAVKWSRYYTIDTFEAEIKLVLK